jgi:hypothetical protein
MVIDHGISQCDVVEYDHRIGDDSKNVYLE